MGRPCVSAARDNSPAEYRKYATITDELNKARGLLSTMSA